MRRVLSSTLAAALLAGGANAQESSASGRLWSRGRTTWVYEAASTSARRLGFLRPGVEMALRDAAPVRGRGCPRGFVKVEPVGYVCLDRSVTLDAGETFVRAAASFLPRRELLPFRYALSNGTPMYYRVPDTREARTAERWFGAPGSFGKLSWGNRAHEELAHSSVISATDPLPSFLREGSAERAPDSRLVRRTLPFGSMLAFSKSFEHAGRTWLLAADGSVVPADRVRPFRTSEFAGVVVGAGKRLPIAFARKSGARQYLRETDGAFRVHSGRWPAKTALFIEGTPIAAGKASYWPTKARADG
ncbi:MAG TPA: hypothetical protein VK524_28680, partial [Polyangiaceae bacterium]|nr:hypothetical protein [Polyangiaceae bacterium]